MINIETILSTFDKQGTLLKWLQNLETALKEATLTDVTVNVISETGITLTFNFADESSITTPTITLPRGEPGTDGVTPDITATATVDETTGTPEVEVEKTGTLEEPNFLFTFKGLKGEQGAAGAGVNFMGTWVTDNDYQENDIVVYTAEEATAAYICISAITGSTTPPPEDTAHWQLFASGGGGGGDKRYMHIVNFGSDDNDWYTFIITDSAESVSVGEWLYNNGFNSNESKYPLFGGTGSYVPRGVYSMGTSDSNVAETVYNVSTLTESTFRLVGGYKQMVVEI